MVLAALSVYATAGTRRCPEKATPSNVRVGTFDSRALALAYYRSEGFRRQMREMKAEYEKAKAAGDEKRVKELEAEGPAHQELAHKQGFSTWPVNDLVERIKAKIPEIAGQAEVDVIVSKWDVVYQRSGVTFVDVTDLMVKPFDPGEPTLALIRQLQTHAPVPLEELTNH